MVAQSRLQGLDDAAAIALMRKLGVSAGDKDVLSIAHAYEKHPLSLTIIGKLASKIFNGSLDRFINEDRLVSKDERICGLLEKMQEVLPSRDDSLHLLNLLAHFIETPSYKQFSGFLHWLVISCAHANLASRPALHIDDDALRNGLAILDDWSMITWDRQNDTLHLHPLIREYYKNHSNQSAQINHALAQWYLTLSPPEDARSLKDMHDRFLAIEHGLLCGNPRLCDAAILMPVLDCNSLSEWLAFWGHQSTGIELLTRVLNRSGEPNHSKHLISRGTMLIDLGKLSSVRNDLCEAIGWLGSNFRKRLKYRKTLAGAYMNRGNVHAESGQPDRAVNDFNLALRVLVSPLGLRRRNELLMADILVNRGSAMRDLGHLTYAERDATKALDIYLKCTLIGSNEATRLSRQIAVAYLNRGNARANGRRYEQANEDYNSALHALSNCEEDTLGLGMHLIATIREMRAQMFDDMNELERAIEEHNAAVSVFSELVRLGRQDIRTMLALAFSNRAETLIALGRLPQALEDVESAMRIYDQTECEEASRPAIWATANQTTLRGINRILNRENSESASFPNAWRDWCGLCCKQGSHVLAPFVRANTIVARLVFKHDPQFSAETVVNVFAAIVAGTKVGYWSEWLLWELGDFLDFVRRHEAVLVSLDVPVARMVLVLDELKTRTRTKGRNHYVPI